MKKFNAMKAAVIGALATLLAAIVGAFIGGLFLLRSSTPPQPTPAPVVMVTNRPQSQTTVMPIQVTPSPTPGATPDPTSTNPQPVANKPFTCTFGMLCTTYPMTIVITTVAIANIGSFTWNLQITNTGTQAIDAYLYAYIDFDEFKVYTGEVQLPSNGTQTVLVTFPAYAPTDGALQDPKLMLEIFR